MPQWMCRYGRDGPNMTVSERYDSSSFTQAILQAQAAMQLEHDVDKFMMPGKVARKYRWEVSLGRVGKVALDMAGLRCSGDTALKNNANLGVVAMVVSLWFLSEHEDGHLSHMAAALECCVVPTPI